jgi:hypothetical protein
VQGQDQAPRLDSSGERVERKEAVNLTATTRLEVAGDGQGTAAEALATQSPWASWKSERGGGVSEVVRFNQTGLVSLTEGYDRWAPPGGYFVNRFKTRGLTVKLQ